MKHTDSKKEQGFSLIEMIIAMSITLVLLGIVSTLLASALGTRQRESSRAAAITASQSALNLMSREMTNTGYGLMDNGIVTADSNAARIHFRSNIFNQDKVTDARGEDVTYYYDSASESILRYDPREAAQTAVVLSRVSEFSLKYYEYSSSAAGTLQTAPTDKTGRITISLTVRLDPVQGQPANQTVKLTSDVLVKNSKYMLTKY